VTAVLERACEGLEGGALVACLDAAVRESVEVLHQAGCKLRMIAQRLSELASVPERDAVEIAARVDGQAVLLRAV
jgi:hypothetical protein